MRRPAAGRERRVVEHGVALQHEAHAERLVPHEQAQHLPAQALHLDGDRLLPPLLLEAAERLLVVLHRVLDLVGALVQPRDLHVTLEHVRVSRGPHLEPVLEGLARVHHGVLELAVLRRHLRQREVPARDR